MRKITKDAVDAFMKGRYYSKDNTYVSGVIDYKRNEVIYTMYLHDSPIAIRDAINDDIQVQTCGYQTNTTKERLNGIPGVNVYQRKGKWYLNGVQWNGELRTINEQWYEIY